MHLYPYSSCPYISHVRSATLSFSYIACITLCSISQCSEFFFYIFFLSLSYLRFLVASRVPFPISFFSFLLLHFYAFLWWVSHLWFCYLVFVSLFSLYSDVKLVLFFVFFFTCVRLTHSCLLLFSCYFSFRFSSYSCHAQGSGEERVTSHVSLEKRTVPFSLCLSFCVYVKLFRKCGKFPMNHLYSRVLTVSGCVLLGLLNSHPHPRLSKHELSPPPPPPDTLEDHLIS